MHLEVFRLTSSQADLTGWSSNLTKPFCLSPWWSPKWIRSNDDLFDVFIQIPNSREWDNLMVIKLQSTKIKQKLFLRQTHFDDDMSNFKSNLQKSIFHISHVKKSVKNERFANCHLRYAHFKAAMCFNNFYIGYWTKVLGFNQGFRF